MSKPFKEGAPRTRLIAAALACVSIVILAPPSRAQQGQPQPASDGENADELRQNPVASLISVPIQENGTSTLGRPIASKM